MRHDTHIHLSIQTLIEMAFIQQLELCNSARVAGNLEPVYPVCWQLITYEALFSKIQPHWPTTHCSQRFNLTDLPRTVLKDSTLTVTMALKTSAPTSKTYARLFTMHCHTKFGHKMLSGSKDMLWTNTYPRIWTLWRHDMKPCTLHLSL